MALTAAQVLECLTLLGLPGRIDVATGYTGGDAALFRHSQVARKLLEQVNAEQETAITAILTQYSGVKYDTDLITAEGLDSSPSRTRARLRDLLAQTIGYTYGTIRGIRVERG